MWVPFLVKNGYSNLWMCRRRIQKRWTVRTVAINGCAKCKFSCAKEQRLKRSSNFLFHYSPPYFILCWKDLCVSRNPQRLCQFLRTRRLQWQGVKFMWPLIPCNPKMTPDFYGLCKFNPTGNFSLSYIDIRSRFSGKYSL